MFELCTQSISNIPRHKILVKENYQNYEPVEKLCRYFSGSERQRSSVDKTI